jgi:hypothetical protein
MNMPTLCFFTEVLELAAGFDFSQEDGYFQDTPKKREKAGLRFVLIQRRLSQFKLLKKSWIPALSRLTNSTDAPLRGIAVSFEKFIAPY